MKSLKKLFTPLLAMGLLFTSCAQNNPAPTVENKFPVKEVVAFYDEAGLDVVVPAYVSEANDFETDTTDPAAFVIYANSSTHDEMVAYKDALVVDSWVVTSEADGDYLLKYAETDAVVTLVDFDEYVGIAFSVTTVSEGMDPLAAATAIGSFWGSTPTLEDNGSYYVGGAFPESSYSVDVMKNYVTNYFVPEEFEVAQDWTSGSFQDETPYEACAYINSINTVLEFYVYSYTVQETPCTVLEVYAYTLAE